MSISAKYLALKLSREFESKLGSDQKMLDKEMLVNLFANLALLK